MLIILLPIFNEEKSIDSLFDALAAYLDAKKYEYKIIACDDGKKRCDLGEA